MEIMSLVPGSKIDCDSRYYIPHLAVERPDSTTAKVRVIFNSLAPTPTGVSLNNVLLVGPSLQSELFVTLIQFQMYKVAFSAGITKMFS